MIREPTKYGKYLLLDRISVGGMAEVFKAKSFGVEGFEKILAIKRILPSMVEDSDFIEMFIDEAKIAGQLNHASICQIFELGRINKSHFIAMEYIPGKDLLQIMTHFSKRKQLIPLPYACYIIAKLCEGLDYAHRKKDTRGRELNIIHRDVSPQNVIVSYEGEIKLIDFGIAKARHRSSQTAAGVLKGKFGYMSPEQVLGAPLDRRSDIFALGTLLYEMATGVRLFHAESDFATLEKVRNTDFDPPRKFNRNIPEGLEQVILRALEKEPSHRYQWGNEMQEELQMEMAHHKPLVSAKRLAAFMKQHFAAEIRKLRELHEGYMMLKHPDFGGPPLTGADRELPDFDDFEEDEATEQLKGAALPPEITGVLSGDDLADEGDFHAENTVIFFENEEAKSEVEIPVPPSADFGPDDLDQPTMMLPDDGSLDQPTMMLPDDGVGGGDDQPTMMLPDESAADAVKRIARESGVDLEEAMGEGPAPARQDLARTSQSLPAFPDDGPVTVEKKTDRPPRPKADDDPFGVGAAPATSSPSPSVKKPAPATAGGGDKLGIVKLVAVGLGAAILGGLIVGLLAKPGKPKAAKRAPPRPAAAVLLVQSDTPAAVTINQKPAGTTGKRGALLLNALGSGQYQVGITASNHIPFKTTFRIEAGQVRLLGPYVLEKTHRPSTIVVSVSPRFRRARVELGKRLLGEADFGKPIKLPMNEAITLRVSMLGYDDFEKTFPASHDKTIKPPPIVLVRSEAGQVLVTSMPKEAAVYLNGKDQGCKTPCRLKDLGLRRKKYSVHVRLTGYTAKKRSFNFKRSRTKKIHFDMELSGEAPPPTDSDGALAKAGEPKGSGKSSSKSSKSSSKSSKSLPMGGTTGGMTGAGAAMAHAGGGCAKGKLVANSVPYSRVYVNGRNTGRNTPIPPRRPLMLSPGRHRVTFMTNRRKRFNYTVTIRPCKVTKLIKRLPVK